MDHIRRAVLACGKPLAKCFPIGFTLKSNLRIKGGGRSLQLRVGGGMGNPIMGQRRSSDVSLAQPGNQCLAGSDIMDFARV